MWKTQCSTYGWSQIWTSGLFTLTLCNHCNNSPWTITTPRQMTMCFYSQQEAGAIHERDLDCVGVGSGGVVGTKGEGSATDAQCCKSFGQFLQHSGQQSRRALLSITLSPWAFWLLICKPLLRGPHQTCWSVVSGHSYSSPDSGG